MLCLCISADSHIYHGFNPSDGASDNPTADRQKMYTHERMSCGYGSMLRCVIVLVQRVQLHLLLTDYR
jgi:hypothetical protein